MAGVHREAIQKQIHQDWANREYIEVITTSIKRITDFLNSFGKCTMYLMIHKDTLQLFFISNSQPDHTSSLTHQMMSIDSF